VLAGNMSDALRFEIIDHIETLGGIPPNPVAEPGAPADESNSNTDTTGDNTATGETASDDAAIESSLADDMAFTLVLDTLFLATASAEFLVQ